MAAGSILVYAYILIYYIKNLGFENRGFLKEGFEVERASRWRDSFEFGELRVAGYLSVGGYLALMGEKTQIKGVIIFS